MKKLLYTSIFLFFITGSNAQSLYFPPISGNTWETTSPDSLGWCTDKIDPLFDFLKLKNTKAFIVLKDGKIVIEKYYDNFVQDSIRYWASAGKTLTGMLVGIAQQEGYLKITDKSSKYLQVGWTSMPQAKEDLITIQNQLSMTTGLDDGVPENDCTIDTCLVYKADAGTRWAYHNAPYTLLDKVIESATGKTFNTYFAQAIRNKIGMNGIWVKQDFNNIYFSTPRSMARYGLLLLNKGNWDGNSIINDLSYINDMTNSSQNINKSYGYLTWLNGKDSYMLPQSQVIFNGSLMKDAPNDLFAAEGKNGQIINVVPSQNLVIVRMGNSPGDGFGNISNFFNNDIWTYLNEIICNSTSTKDHIEESVDLTLASNLVKNQLHIINNGVDGEIEIQIYNTNGSLVYFNKNQYTIDISSLKNGTYFIKLKTKEVSKTLKFVKI